VPVEWLQQRQSAGPETVVPVEKWGADLNSTALGYVVIEGRPFEVAGSMMFKTSGRWKYRLGLEIAT